MGAAPEGRLRDDLYRALPACRLFAGHAALADRSEGLFWRVHLANKLGGDLGRSP